jgi:hypothetical protein
MERIIDSVQNVHSDELFEYEVTPIGINLKGKFSKFDGKDLQLTLLEDVELSVQSSDIPEFKVKQITVSPTEHIQEFKPLTPIEPIQLGDISKVEIVETKPITPIEPIQLEDISKVELVETKPITQIEPIQLGEVSKVEIVETKPITPIEPIQLEEVSKVEIVETKPITPIEPIQLEDVASVGEIDPDALVTFEDFYSAELSNEFKELIMHELNL